VLVLLGGLSLMGPGGLPRLGPLLEPRRGIWSVARDAELPSARVTGIPGLQEAVEVRYDERAVPHIFAANQADAVRVLGYVVARDRLFQMELQARAGGGTLTELLGPRALPLDRETRGLGMPAAAEARLAEAAPSSTTRVLIEAYAAGVNARIAELGGGGVPLEYQLLGRRPAPWASINSLHLLNRMGYTLTQSDLEARKAVAARAVGAAAADALYPRVSPIQEPIQPNGLRAAREELPRIPAPDPATPQATGAGPSPRLGPGVSDALGSNNWAVAPARSATGHALLAGDPHLELSLPAIWYEAHIVVRDSLDVYGVTIPGAPVIVLGFNRDVAWSFTNVEADLQDRYLEVVDDEGAPGRYRVDGAWRQLAHRVERYLGPGGALLWTDTVRFTHRGPLTRSSDGAWRSLRWTLLESPSGLEALARATAAQSVTAWLEDMTGWLAIPQNMAVADRSGSIAIRSTGRFPIRPGDRGDLVVRGDSSAADWLGDWPLEEWPQAVNPAQGYVASANQQPVDPKVTPRYLGANWYSPWRALRINALLRADSQVTVDDMRRFQTDPASAAAQRLMPAFLAAAHKFPAHDSLQQATARLAEWDGRYTVDNTRAVLFEAAVSELQHRLWDELATTGRRPGLVLVWALLADSANPWWDDRRTPEVRESRDDLLAAALLVADGRIQREHGPPDAGGWRWSLVRGMDIHHLLRIPAFSVFDVPVQGGLGTLSPLSEGDVFGASWRMVVELGPEVRGWGTYPGGQSGNPASSRYLDRLATWRDGGLDTLRFPRRPEDLAQVRSTLRLEPVR
jgi:penicillin amidase